MIRSAIAVWRGSPAIGEGAVSTTSGVMTNALYSFGSATGNEPCTSPSEMLAASVASCASLMVAQEMAKAHLKYESVQTEAVLTLQEKMGHWEISGIELQVSSHLPQRDAEKFHKAAKAANVCTMCGKPATQLVDGEPSCESHIEQVYEHQVEDYTSKHLSDNEWRKF